MNKSPTAFRGVLIISTFVIALIVAIVNQTRLGDMVLLIVFAILVYVIHRPTHRLVKENVGALFSIMAELLGAGGVESSGLSNKSLLAVPSNGYPAKGYWDIPRVYAIKLPKETDWRPDQSNLFMSRVVQLGRVILRIKGTRDEIMWQLIDANAQVLPADEVRRAIRSAFVEADVSEPEMCFAPVIENGFYRRVDFYQQTDEFLRPSLRSNDINRTDPLEGIVNSFVDLQEREWVSYTLALGGMGDQIEQLYQVGIESITTGKMGLVLWNIFKAALSQGNLIEAIAAALGAAIGGVTQRGRLDKYDPATMKVCGEKLNELPLMRCYLAIEANSPIRQRLDHFEYGIPFMQHFSTEYQKFTHTNEPVVQIVNSAIEQRTNIINLLVHLLTIPLLPLDPRACVFVPSEMSALWHLPHTGMTASEIVWKKGKQVAAPPAFRKTTTGVKLGTNRPTSSDIYQPTSERLLHTLIIGKTGTGKTTLQLAQIIQDIFAGRGVFVLDPMGGMIKQILRHGVPIERVKDVVILDIGFRFTDQGNAFYPPPLNPLAKLNGVHNNMGVSDFATILGKFYQDTGQTRWMQTIQSALELLTAEEHPVIDDLLNVFDDRAYRDQLISHFGPRIAEKWARIERSGGLSETSVQSALWRVSQFLDNDMVRASTCHPDELDLFTLIRQNKIILVSVHADEALIPKSAQNVLGAIILSQVQRAAMADAVADPVNKPFMVYVDEVQDFVTHSLDELARQARQKGLGLVVATQDTSTIAPKTLKALESNIGTLIAFECNADDARSALDLMPGFSVPDLMNMGRFQAVVSMRAPDGMSRAAFSLDPLPFPDLSHDPEAPSREMYLRRKSVEKYTSMSYDQVISLLDARYRRQEKPPQKEDEQDDFGNPITT